MLFRPVHDVVVDKALTFEQVLKQSLDPHVVGFLLELQGLYVVEVFFELLGKAFAEIFDRYRRLLFLYVQFAVF